MKTQVCSFSGFKALPGVGKTVVRADGKVNYFINRKSERSFMMKRNPREVCWTILYRRKNRKGNMEDEKSKKRSKRCVKPVRAVAGVSKDDILLKRNQKPEFREAMREEAIRAAKEISRKKDLERKTRKMSELKKAGAPKAKIVQKNVAAKAPKVGGKR